MPQHVCALGEAGLHPRQYRPHSAGALAAGREPFAKTCSILFFKGTNAGVNNSQLLDIFLRGALGSRGRKRARRAAHFLSGKKGFLTASTVLGAAGVAWGIYDSLKASAPATGGPAATGPMPAGGSVVPPP